VSMYADDMIYFSESVDGLQLMLNRLLSYTNRWSLTINAEKTKIVVFIELQAS